MSRAPKSLKVMWIVLNLKAQFKRSGVYYHFIQTFLNREPDSNGLNAWTAVLDSGLSQTTCVQRFAESDEFTKICNEYGIIRGNAILTAPMDQNEGVTKFIARCYRFVSDVLPMKTVSMPGAIRY